MHEPKQNMLTDQAHPDNPSGFDDPEPDRPTEEAVQTEEETVVEEVAEELNVNLPKVNLPLPMKIVALITLIGGLSLIASSFTNIFDSTQIPLKTYLLNLVAGFIFIVISYLLVKRQNLATWLYGLLVVIALFINWPLAVLPLILLVYLIFNRKYLYPSFMDRLYHLLATKLSKQMK